MLSNSFEKQRETPAFFEMWFGKRNAHIFWKFVWRILGLFIFTVWNAFEQYWKAQETLAFFQILFGIRMGGGLAGGGAKTWQTEIYYRSAYFYCFKCVRLVSKGNARLFLNYVWRTRLSRPKYITGLFIFTIWNAFDYYWKERTRPPFFKLC